jgi:hypothetical protein
MTYSLEGDATLQLRASNGIPSGRQLSNCGGSKICTVPMSALGPSLPSHLIPRTSPSPRNTSKPITGETTYTLSCLALDGAVLTKEATVKIIPTFQEK